MALHYDISCRHCGEQDGYISDYVALTIEGKDMPLYHPGEHDDARQLGWEWEDAARAGILHVFRAYSCLECGATTYVKRLQLPTGLTNMPIVVVVLIATLFFLFVSHNIWLCALAASVAAIPAATMDKRLSRSRFLREHGYEIIMTCERCASAELVLMDKLLCDRGRGPILCRKCGRRKAEIESVAIS